jgi:hypothetical protein
MKLELDNSLKPKVIETLIINETKSAELAPVQANATVIF